MTVRRVQVASKVLPGVYWRGMFEQVVRTHVDLVVGGAKSHVYLMQAFVDQVGQLVQMSVDLVVAMAKSFVHMEPWVVRVVVRIAEQLVHIAVDKHGC